MYISALYSGTVTEMYPDPAVTQTQYPVTRMITNAITIKICGGICSRTISLNVRCMVSIIQESVRYCKLTCEYVCAIFSCGY